MSGVFMQHFLTTNSMKSLRRVLILGHSPIGVPLTFLLSTRLETPSRKARSSHSLYAVCDDLILLLNFFVGVHFMLRGRAKHANLTWSNFRILDITSVKYLGRKKLEIVNLQDKCMHVLVEHPVRRNNTGYLDTVQCLENKLTCVVYWVLYYWTLCPPNQHQFYCYKAHQKLMKVRIRIWKSLLYWKLIYFLF